MFKSTNRVFDSPAGQTVTVSGTNSLLYYAIIGPIQDMEVYHNFYYVS